MNGKIYGNEKTHLSLTDKAQKLYDRTDPLEIEEIETKYGFRYNMRGVFKRTNMTEAELIEDLEALYDELYAPKKISLDNGRTMLTADEVAEELGESYSAQWAMLINNMDDEVRERVHEECAPCSPVAFLKRYLELAEDDLIIG